MAGTGRIPAIVKRIDWGIDWGISGIDWGTDWGISGIDWGIDWGISRTDWGTDWGISRADWSTDWGISGIDWGTDWGISRADWGTDWGISRADVFILAFFSVREFVVESIKRNGYNDTVFIKFNPITTIHFCNSWNTAPSSFADVKLKKNIGKSFIDWNGFACKKAFHRLIWRKISTR